MSSTTESRHLLEVSDLDVRFKLDAAKVHAVKGTSFHVDRGETLAIVGESGSGKSVTARAIMQLLPKNATVAPQTRILFQGARIDNLASGPMRAIRGNGIAMIFQEPMSSLNPVYRIGDQIAETLQLHQGLSKRQALARALDLLKEVRIPDPEARLEQYPHQLSGGQRQRVMIAIAIANNPELLIADEPTTALDVTVQAEILKLIRQIQANYRMGVILITHDLTIVQKVSDRVAVMRLGQLVETGDTPEIFARPQHPYTKKLIASEPKGRPNPVADDRPILLDAEKVRVQYQLNWGGIFSKKTRTLVAVDDVSLKLRTGETLGVVGESGSGKSTLGKAILRLVHLDGGEVTFKGERIDAKTKVEMRRFRPHMQIVFQDPFSSLNPRLSVRQIVEEGLIVNGLGGSAKERDAQVRRTLEEVGLDSNALNRFPHEFSGGQRQRIAIARALILNPEFMLLDEPTSALDLSVQAQVIDLLRDLQRRRGLTYLFISHDLKVVRALCHKVIVMSGGKVVEAGTTDQVMDAPREDYTKRLIRAALEVDA
ncbi:ABC transporter ATP-binding protein [Kaistia dalseonensis]|uniref:Peptide/nickel transport system ATP-binding protein n=1 Tax=Kaistia dalseonensis TaxID=410840 RepID=A0ABU0HDG5_9HYPH|nr:ABC transporter ATP-binding protein [Kaistia dalseonensis]MCX5497714.1 ABC transporter ATP-binding protein [Kaistia dalseonensis]MDQ0440358.1 peptide/nickel transport system ATP-binding protein [Kaistia dalseonensis]